MSDQIPQLTMLLPDNRILAEIFKDHTPVPKTIDCHVITNTLDTCTFSLRHSSTARWPEEILVRLELSDIGQAIALHTVAATQLPELLPYMLVVGKVTSESEVEIHFSVTEFLADTVVLEEIWDSLSEEHQDKMMESIVSAVRKLQGVDRSTVALLSNGLYTEDSVGGPSIGISPDFRQFLHDRFSNEGSLLQIARPSVEDDGPPETTVQGDTTSVSFSQEDLDHLSAQIVLCHNDLEPRNVLVRKWETKGESLYTLAAIIDWEMAGFYPSAYEYSIKDKQLGSSNLSSSWYSLYKKHLQQLLPVQACVKKLIQALSDLAIAEESRMQKNVGVRVQAEWRTIEQVERSSDILQGWVRRADATEVKSFTKEDNDLLVTKGLEELGDV